MTPWTPVDIFFRWLHIVTACVVFGSAFFMRFVMPAAIKPLDPESRDATFLRTRRAFKMVVHSCILLFLISGIYNAVRNWPTYNNWPGVAHGLFGLHLLIALIIWTIALWLLAGREPRRNHAKWMKFNVILLFLTVAVASTLKWVREYAHDHPRASRAQTKIMTMDR